MNESNSNKFGQHTPLWQDKGKVHWLSRLGHTANLSQRLSRARLVYLRRAEARWGWLALCLFLAMAVPVPGHSSPVDEPGGGTLLLGAKDSPYVAPPLSTKMDVSVSGPIARINIEQTFVNPSDEWVEGRYLFPLPDGAAVDELRVETGDSIIEGEIREKEQAKKEYQQAKKEGRRAGVVQQKRANLFSLALANIGPGEQIVVRLAYMETLEYRDENYQLRLPLTLTERFQPDPIRSGVLQANAAKPVSFVFNVEDSDVDTPYVSGIMAPTADIRVSLLGNRWPDEIDSSSHRLGAEKRADSLEVSVAGGFANMDRDFTLRWKPPAGEQPDMMVLTETLKDENYALLMFLPPEPGLVQALPRELILIIDTSGSMHGESIHQAKQAVYRALSSLQATDRFNLIEFNNYARRLFENAVPADPGNIDRAQRFTAGLNSDGGTNMASALDIALDGSGGAGYLRQVVFITDGAVGNENELLNGIKHRLGDDRLFTVGIGPSPNGHFMRKAAQFGRGSYTFINDVAKVEEQMGGLLGRLEKPALKNIELQWPNGLEVEQWPAKIPDLYAGEPMIVAARFDRMPDNVTVQGDGAFGPWQVQAPLVSKQAAPGVSKLWARRKIEALMDDAIAAGNREQAREPVVEVALAHHLVSTFTSLLAVERKVVRPASMPMGNLRVANATPRNAAQIGLPRGATPAGVWRLAGFFLLLLTITWFAVTRQIKERRLPLAMATRREAI